MATPFHFLRVNILPPLAPPPPPAAEADPFPSAITDASSIVSSASPIAALCLLEFEIRSREIRVSLFVVLLLFPEDRFLRPGQPASDRPRNGDDGAGGRADATVPSGFDGVARTSQIRQNVEKSRGVGNGRSDPISHRERVVGGPPNAEF